MPFWQTQKAQSQYIQKDHPLKSPLHTTASLVGVSDNLKVF